MPTDYFHKMMTRLAQQNIFFIAGLGSILLSLIAFTNSSHIINTDGILYLQAADIFLKKDFTQTLLLNNWPFYSILIALISKLSSLPLEISARLFNAILQLIIVIAFIAVVRQLTHNRTVQWLAVLVILIFPELNHIRDNIIRDFGYWACYLASLYYLLRYAETCAWFYALCYGALLIIATLFRIEGMIFLIFAPLILFANSERSFKQRCIMFVTAQSVNIALGIGLLCYLLLHHTSPQHLGRLNSVQALVSSGLPLLIDHFKQTAQALTMCVLPLEASDSAFSFLISGLIGSYMLTLVSALSVLYSCLAVYGMLRGTALMNGFPKRVLYFYILLNLLITGFFISQKMFLSQRYVLGLCFILILFVPFALYQLRVYWSLTDTASRGLRLIISLLLISMAVGSMVEFGPSKAYIKEAGLWLKQHAPEAAKVYSNSPEVIYYSQLPNANWMESAAGFSPIIEGGWEKYRYLAIKISRKDRESEATIFKKLQRKPLVIFHNRAGDRILIFKTSE